MGCAASHHTLSSSARSKHADEGSGGGSTGDGGGGGGGGTHGSTLLMPAPSLAGAGSMQSTVGSMHCPVREFSAILSASSQFKQRESVRVAEEMLRGSKGKRFHDCYVRPTLASYGASCKVLTAFSKAGQRKCAVKTIPKNHKDAANQRARVLAEIGILKAVEDHPNAVRLLEVIEGPESYYLVMECCNGGELFEHISKEVAGFTERQAAQILRGLMLFLAHMHSRGIAHMDIKPENLMFDNEGAQGILKVIDFGSSVFVQPNEVVRDAFGTVRYSSPEMANDLCGQKTDIWSAGVVMYLLLCGQAPFLRKDDEDTLNMIKKKPKVKFSGSRWDIISQAAKNCIREMLDPNPLTRPSAVQVLQMPWLKTQAPETIIQADILTHLRAFANQSRIRRLLLGLMASNLSGGEANRLLGQFYSMDSDFSGTIECQELVTSARKVLPDLTDEEATRMFEALDVDGGGTVDVKEFFAGLLQTMDAEKQALIARRSFRELERRGTGVVTKEIFISALLERAGSDAELVISDDLAKELEAEFAALDANGDGVLSFEEFQAALGLAAAAGSHHIQQRSHTNLPALGALPGPYPRTSSNPPSERTSSQTPVEQLGQLMASATALHRVSGLSGLISASSGRSGSGPAQLNSTVAHGSPLYSSHHQHQHSSGSYTQRTSPRASPGAFSTNPVQRLRSERSTGSRLGGACRDDSPRPGGGIGTGSGPYHLSRSQLQLLEAAELHVAAASVASGGGADGPFAPYAPPKLQYSRSARFAESVKDQQRPDAEDGGAQPTSSGRSVTARIGIPGGIASTRVSNADTEDDDDRSPRRHRTSERHADKRSRSTEKRSAGVGPLLRLSLSGKAASKGTGFSNALADFISTAVSGLRGEDRGSTGANAAHDTHASPRARCGHTTIAETLLASHEAHRAASRHNSTTPAQQQAASQLVYQPWHPSPSRMYSNSGLMDTPTVAAAAPSYSRLQSSNGGGLPEVASAILREWSACPQAVVGGSLDEWTRSGRPSATAGYSRGISGSGALWVIGGPGGGDTPRAMSRQSSGVGNRPSVPDSGRSVLSEGVVTSPGVTVFAANDVTAQSGQSGNSPVNIAASANGGRTLSGRPPSGRPYSRTPSGSKVAMAVAAAVLPDDGALVSDQGSHGQMCDATTAVTGHGKFEGVLIL